MEQTEDFLSSQAQMVRPHTKNRIFKGGKRNIRMESSGDPTDRMTKNMMAG